MRIAIAMSKSQYHAGEAISATVRIVNDGPSAIDVPRVHSNENWQPTYTMVGPAYPKGKTVSFRSAAFGEGLPAGAQPETMKLAPGESKAEELPLGRLIRIAEPGTYAVTADLSWNGVEAHSATTSFVVVPSALKSCQLLSQPGLSDRTRISAFCLVGSESGPQEIHHAGFDVHPQLQNIMRSGLAPFAVVPKSAEAVIGLWEAHPHDKDGPSTRAVYQAGTRLGIVGYRESVTEATLPFSVRAIRPALGLADGDVEVFVLDGEGTRLALVHFDKERTGLDIDWSSMPPGLVDDDGKPPLRMPRVEGGGPPKLLWTTNMPARIASGRVALLAGTGPQRHVLLAAGEPDGTLLLLVDVPGGSGAPSLHTVRIPNLHVRSNSEPGLYIDAEGVARASVILESSPRPDGSLDVWLAEAIWDRRRAPPRIETAMLMAVPAPIRAAAVNHSASGGLMRAWALVTADGQVRSNSTSRLDLKGSPSLPLDLLVVDNLSALLTLDPFGVPDLERL